MNRPLRMSLSLVAVLFVHIYVVGGLIAAFTAAEGVENWSVDGKLNEVMTTWMNDYVNPLHTLRVSIVAKSDYEELVRKRIWMGFPITLLLVAIFSFRTIFFSKAYKDASDYGSHGSARWAKPDEIFRPGELTGAPYNELETAGVVLGYQEKWFGRKKYITIPPDSELNQNVLVLGGSGSGKDYTFISTQIMNTMVPFEPKDRKRIANMKRRKIPREYSLLAIDPKGETYENTAAILMQNGYEVYAFNLVHMKRSHRWNPLDYIEEDIDAQKLANLIVSNSRTETKGGDPFWPKAEKALMSAIILFVKYELPPEQQNLPNVLHIGTTYGGDEDALNMLFDALPYNHPALAQYKIFRLAPEETRAGILIGFGTELSLFAYHQIAELTSQSDFRFDDMGKKKTALFLIIPDSDTTFAPITQLFLTQAFQQWWRVADDNGGACPVGIRFIGNELANVGRIPQLAERASVMRSKGISVQLFFQAQSQVEKEYKEDAKSLIQNCDTTVFLGTNDKDTAKEMSEALGDKTIQVQSTSQQMTTFVTVNPNESKQYQARRLRTPDEIRKNSRRKNIILQNASNPFETIKMPYVEHPKIKGLEFTKISPSTLTPPPHKGFELFSQADYDKIVGLTLEPSNEDSQEVRENFREQLASAGEETSVLDQLHVQAPLEEAETDEIAAAPVRPEALAIVGTELITDTKVHSDREQDPELMAAIIPGMGADPEERHLEQVDETAAAAAENATGERALEPEAEAVAGQAAEEAVAAMAEALVSVVPETLPIEQIGHPEAEATEPDPEEPEDGRPAGEQEGSSNKPTGGSILDEL